jgi:hypothetical protein
VRTHPDANTIITEFKILLPIARSGSPVFLAAMEHWNHLNPCRTQK